MNTVCDDTTRASHYCMDKAQALGFVNARADIFDADPNPFNKSAWLVPFIEHCVDGEILVIGNTLLHGDGRPLTNYYAGQWSPIDLAVSQLPLVSRINFAPLADPGPLQEALKANGWWCRRYFHSANWYMQGLPYGQYLSGRSSKLRNTLKRKGKAFCGDLEMVTTQDVDAAMDAYENVYAKSWQGKAQRESHPAFIRAWAHACAEKGWLRLGLAFHDGGPIAVAFWFVIDGVAYIFKLAFDEDHKSLSAGSLLTAMLMEHVLDVDKVTEVDYLTGDDDYKKEWMTHRRERVGLAACNLRTIRGTAMAGYEWLGSLRQRSPAP